MDEKQAPIKRSVKANNEVVPIFHSIQGSDLGVLRDALTRERAYVERHFNRGRNDGYRIAHFDRVARIDAMLKRIENGQ